MGSTSHLQNTLLQTIRALASTFKIHIKFLALVAYRRSSNGMWLLSAWNIIINLVLPFIFSNGGRLWTAGLTNTVLEVEGVSEGGATYPRPVLSVRLFWMDSMRVSISSVTLSNWSCVFSSFSSSSWILSSNELLLVCKLFRSWRCCLRLSLRFSYSTKRVLYASFSSSP